MLKEILEELGIDGAKIKEILKAMKDKKIYMSGEENIDERYSKLKDQHALTTQEHEKATGLIEELKKSAGDNEESKTKIADYEAQMQKLQEENEALKLDNAIKVFLLSHKAKSADLDYLMFKVKNGDYKLNVDDNGSLSGLDVKTLQTAHPSNFEGEAKNEVIPKKMPEGKVGGDGISKEDFKKMNANEMMDLRVNDPETFKKLSGQ